MIAWNNLRPVRKFAVNLALILTLANLLMAFSPMAEGWFLSIANLPPDLTRFALLPFRMAILLPALAVAQSIQRAVLVNNRRNAPITWSTGLEVGVIALTMMIFSSIIPLNGVSAAIIALVLGRSVSNVYLYRFYRQETRLSRVQPTVKPCVELMS